MSTPVLNTDNPPDDQGYFCPGDAVGITATCLSPTGDFITFVKAEFELTTQPPGSNGAFSPAEFTAEANPYATTFNGDTNGSYEYIYRCTYSTGPTQPEVPDANPNAQIVCPSAVEENGRFNVSLYGLDDYSNIVWTLTGQQAFFGFSQRTRTIVAATAGSQVDIEVTADLVDADGNIIDQITLTCAVPVYDPTLDRVTTESDEMVIQAVDCGEVCFEVKGSITLNCPVPEKEFLSIDLHTFAQTPRPVVPNTGPLTQVPVFGALLKSQLPVGDSLCDDCDDDCFYDIPQPLDHDRPAIIYNNAAHCPGWSAPGDQAKAFCYGGEPYCFSGSGSLTISGPQACSADVIIIYGHNFENVTVTSSAGVFGGSRNFGLCQDRAQIGGFTRPLVVNLADLVTSNSFTIDFAGNGTNGDPVCIDYVMVGQKLFVPGDCLNADFANPLDGSDTRIDVKYSECGIVSMYSTQVPVDWSVTIDGPQTWFEDYWRSLMRYSKQFPVGFLPSRNNAEQDFLLGISTKPIGGSKYISCNLLENTLALSGYICQPQTKAYA